MSQYPSPYQPPNYTPYYVDPYAQLLAPARKASILMFILGGIGVACSTCTIAMRSVMPWNQLPPEQAEVFRQVEATFGLPFQTVLLIWAIMVFIPSALMLIFGAIVRKGTKGAVYAGIAYVGLLLALLAIGLVLTLLGAATDPQRARGIIPDVCFTFIMGGLLALAMGWLIQAAKNARLIAAAQAQYQAQYWQYMQYQQMYGQAMPPPPPPPPSNPEQPPQQ